MNRRVLGYPQISHFVISIESRGLPILKKFSFESLDLMAGKNFTFAVWPMVKTDFLDFVGWALPNEIPESVMTP